MSNQAGIALKNDWLLDLLDLGRCSFDLYQGTVVDPGNNRAIFLSTDVLRGIYRALNEEAGAAWKVIFNTCGRTWGKAYLRVLQKQLLRFKRQRWEQASVEEFLDLLVATFSANGWGIASFDLRQAYEHGIIRVQFRNSLVNEALNEDGDRVDYLVAGMLSGIFSELAGIEVGCIEVVSEMYGEPLSEFVLSGADRMEEVHRRVAEGEPVEAAIGQLEQPLS